MRRARGCSSRSRSRLGSLPSGTACPSSRRPTGPVPKSPGRRRRRRRRLSLRGRVLRGGQGFDLVHVLAGLGVRGNAAVFLDRAHSRVVPGQSQADHVAGQGGGLRPGGWQVGRERRERLDVLAVVDAGPAAVFRGRARVVLDGDDSYRAVFADRGRDDFAAAYRQGDVVGLVVGPADQVPESGTPGGGFISPGCFSPASCQA